MSVRRVGAHVQPALGADGVGVVVAQVRADGALQVGVHGARAWRCAIPYIVASTVKSHAAVRRLLPRIRPPSYWSPTRWRSAGKRGSSRSGPSIGSTPMFTTCHVRSSSAARNSSKARSLSPSAPYTMAYSYRETLDPALGLALELREQVARLWRCALHRERGGVVRDAAARPPGERHRVLQDLGGPVVVTDREEELAEEPVGQRVVRLALHGGLEHLARVVHAAGARQDPPVHGPHRQVEAGDPLGLQDPLLRLREAPLHGEQLGVPLVGRHGGGIELQRALELAFRALPVAVVVAQHQTEGGVRVGEALVQRQCLFGGRARPG